MKALQGVDGHVEWVEAERPACDAGQVRIRVAAAGLNRADLLQMKGLYPPPPGASPYMGLECAGVVEEVGAGADWRVGDRVCALLASGAMAEEVVVDARHVLPVPEGLSLHEAAALPEVYATAWLNIFQLGAVKAGEKVLVHAGASGVGSAAIQLCKAFGSPVWVSVGSQDRLAYCEALGATGGVVRNENLDALEGFGPFDVILDPVGASYGELNLKLLARDGRWVIIGLMGGASSSWTWRWCWASAWRLPAPRCATAMTASRPSCCANCNSRCGRCLPKGACRRNWLIPTRWSLPRRRMRSLRATRSRASW